MRLFLTSLIILSFSIVGHSANDHKSDFYRGIGIERDHSGKSKGSYSVLLEVAEWSNHSAGTNITTITTIRTLEDGNLTLQTLKLLVTGTDSFTILDQDGDQLGWGYEMEFEREDSPKVHALLLNYRLSDKPDSNIVSHFIRYVRADGSIDSTGSIVDSNGKMVSAWSERAYKQSD